MPAAVTSTTEVLLSAAGGSAPGGRAAGLWSSSSCQAAEHPGAGLKSMELGGPEGAAPSSGGAPLPASVVLASRTLVALDDSEGLDRSPGTGASAARGAFAGPQVVDAADAQLGLGSPRWAVRAKAAGPASGHAETSSCPTSEA
mmetsp:Transcript_5881/g.24759  ORF Transcript_5881/g.24759 Transcript_5881/m.24759 type:complete len:144 (-) Transcript_5881:718-1149(-)